MVFVFLFPTYFTLYDRHAHIVTLSLIKEARIYNGEKTASSISGAVKTGQLHVKE